VSLLLAGFPFSPDWATNVFPSRRFEELAASAGIDATERRTSAATEAATGDGINFIESTLRQKDL
jgi:hypothetical protein